MVRQRVFYPCAISLLFYYEDIPQEVGEREGGKRERARERETHTERERETHTQRESDGRERGERDSFVARTDTLLKA